MKKKQEAIHYLERLPHDRNEAVTFMDALFGYGYNKEGVFKPRNWPPEKSKWSLCLGLFKKVAWLLVSLSWHNIPRYVKAFFTNLRFRGWRLNNHQLVSPINFPSSVMECQAFKEHFLWTQQGDWLFCCQKGTAQIWCARLNVDGKVKEATESSPWNLVYCEGLSELKSPLIALTSQYGYLQATTSSGVLHLAKVLQVLNTPLIRDKNNELISMVASKNNRATECSITTKSNWMLTACQNAPSQKLVLKNKLPEAWEALSRAAVSHDTWRWIPHFKEQNLAMCGPCNTTMKQSGHSMLFISRDTNQVQVYEPCSSWFKPGIGYKLVHTRNIKEGMLADCSMLADKRLLFSVHTADEKKKVYRERHPFVPMEPSECSEEEGKSLEANTPVDELASFEASHNVILAPQLQELPWNLPLSAEPCPSYWESVPDSGTTQGRLGWYVLKEDLQSKASSDPQSVVGAKKKKTSHFATV